MVDELNESNFDAAIKGSRHVLVDFWAPWCGPCRAVAPNVEKIAEAYEGRLKVYKVNVDDSPGLAQRFGIMGIPSLMLFQDGQLKDKVVGAMPFEGLKRFVDKNLQ
ncbi:MAG: thioredoxin [Candidatus Micrarchaeota archaeon]|nr:thioredoxin [Candidatus Micrarchaeota archaeon]